MKFRAIAFLALLSFSPASAQEDTAFFGPETARKTLLMRSTTDIDVFAPVIEAFLSRRPDVGIAYEQWGSNDLAALSAKNCQMGTNSADLVISSAVDLQVQLVNNGCAVAHYSAATNNLPASRNGRNEILE